MNHTFIGMNDISNAYECLDRALKKVGLQLVDDSQELKHGKPVQFIALMRKLLIGTSTIVAKQLLGRGCPSHANDKKLVITAFDILRDNKQAPSISVEQFFNQSGFVYHKLVVLTRIADYVSKNAGIKPAGLTAYYVLSDNSSIFDGSDLLSPEFLRSAAYTSRKTASPITMDSSISDWPLSDFIRQHINENKDSMTREKFKKNVIRSRTLANMAYVAEENIISHAMVGNSGTGSAYSSPVPNRSGKSRSSSAGKIRLEHTNNSQFNDGNDSVQDMLLQTEEYSPLSGGSGGNNGGVAAANGNDQLYSLLRSPAAQSGRTITTTTNSKPTPDNGSATKASATRSSSIPRSRPSKNSGLDDSDDGPYSSPPPVFRRDANGNPIKGETAVNNYMNNSSNHNSNINNNNTNNNSNNAASGIQAAEEDVRRTEELVQFLEEKYSQKVIEKLEYEFNKKMEAKLEQLIEAKVAAAVKDVTERYDFIINKLVAAVDSEFALLNNQLKMASGLKN